MTAQWWDQEAGQIVTHNFHGDLQQYPHHKQEYQQQNRQHHQQQQPEQHQQHHQQPEQQHYHQQEELPVEEVQTVSIPNLSAAQPLTLNSRPSNSPSALLEQTMVKKVMPIPVETETAEAIAPPSLTAFRALLSQTKSEYPLQLLNTREPVAAV